MAEGDITFSQNTNTLCEVEQADGTKQRAVYVVKGGTLVPTPDALESTTLVVGVTPDTFEVEEDGTWVANGDSTTWDDVVNSLIGRRLFSRTGTIDYDYDENAILMQADGDITSQNDRVVFNLQYPHSAKEDGMMNLHCHWFQISADDIEFTVQYRVQSNNDTKTETWTEVVVSSSANNIFPYTSGTLNQITKLVDIDMTGAGISATVQFRFTRSDDIDIGTLVTFVDAHVENDMNGSREEFVK